MVVVVVAAVVGVVVLQPADAFLDGQARPGRIGEGAQSCQRWKTPMGGVVPKKIARGGGGTRGIGHGGRAVP
jgi:hypothetical protein